MIVPDVLCSRALSYIKCSVALVTLFVLVLHREVITVLPDFVQVLGAAIRAVRVFQVSMWARCELTLTNKRVRGLILGNCNAVSGMIDATLNKRHIHKYHTIL